MAWLIQGAVDSRILLNNRRNSNRVLGSLGLMNTKEYQDSPMQEHWHVKARLIDGRVRLNEREFYGKCHVQDIVLPNQPFKM